MFRTEITENKPRTGGLKRAVGRVELACLGVAFAALATARLTTGDANAMAGAVAAMAICVWCPTVAITARGKDDLFDVIGVSACGLLAGVFATHPGDCPAAVCLAMLGLLFGLCLHLTRIKQLPAGV